MKILFRLALLLLFFVLNSCSNDEKEISLIKENNHNPVSKREACNNIGHVKYVHRSILHIIT